MTFQFIDQNNEGLLEVEFQATKEQVQEKWSEACKEFKKYQVSGFRPGKAPDILLKKKFKFQMENWIQQNLIQEAYRDFLFQNEIKPFGLPSIKNTNLTDDSFYCSWSMFKSPKIQLQKYIGLSYPKIETESLEQTTEKLLNQLMEQKSSFADYEEGDFVKDGDLVLYKYVSSTIKNNEKIILKDEQNAYLVGSNPPKEIENLNNLLSGLSLNQTKSWTENEKENIVYELTLIKGQKRILPELNDKFAKDLGCLDLSDLQNKISLQAQKHLKQVEKQKIDQDIIAQLLEANQFNLPNWIQSLEREQLIKSFGENWKNLSDEEKQNYIQASLQNLKLSLILEAVRDAEPEVNFSDREILNLLQKQFSSHDEMQKELKNMSSEKLQNTMAILRDGMTLEWILNRAEK